MIEHLEVHIRKNSCLCASACVLTNLLKIHFHFEVLAEESVLFVLVRCLCVRELGCGPVRKRVPACACMHGCLVSLLPWLPSQSPACRVPGNCSACTQEKVVVCVRCGCADLACTQSYMAVCLHKRSVEPKGAHLLVTADLWVCT